MLHETEKLRYSRQIMLPETGIAGQEKLKTAKVLVAGAGGLGCPVLLYLAAAGVGTIGIADGDSIDISNLPRQVLYTAEEAGMPKAVVAGNKLRQQNPHCDVRVHNVSIDSTNVAAIITQYDIVVDGTDNFATRYLLNDICVMLDKPLVSGAVFRFEGQVSVFNYKGGPTYRCLFPEAGGLPDCATTGVIATLPGMVGTLQANEVIKIITGAGEVLSGRLLVIDALTMQSNIFHFTVNEQNRNVPALQTIAACNTGISYDTLQREMALGHDIQLIDVREPDEHAAFNIGGSNIPLSLLETAVLPAVNKSIVLYCASGARSMQAVQILQRKGFMQVRSLTNGIRLLPHS